MTGILNITTLNIDIFMTIKRQELDKDLLYLINNIKHPKYPVHICHDHYKSFCIC